MKQLIAITAFGAAILFGCSGSSQLTQAQPVVNTYGKDEQLSDTFLHRLQQENDLVLAAYSESLGWGRHYNYTIAVRKGGTWKGYSYTISGTINNARTQVNDVTIDAKAADAATKFLNNAAIWSGKDNHTTCNMQVADGSSSYLLMAAGSKVLHVNYYMPDVYQQSCPDSSRALFIEAFGKVRGLNTSK